MARGPFMASLYATLSPSLIAAFFMDNLVPMGIWVAATFVVVFAASRRKYA